MSEVEAGNGDDEGEVLSGLCEGVSAVGEGEDAFHCKNSSCGSVHGEYHGIKRHHHLL